MNAAADRLARGVRRLGAAGGAGPLGRWFVIALPYLWLAVFFLIPFLIVLKISFAQLAIAQPPYTPLFICTDPARADSSWGCFLAGHLKPDLYTQAYGYLVAEPLYIKAYWNSVVTAFWSTILCLLIGYPMAYGMARSSPT
ncbi:MAG TPA: hypothetical protein VMU00_08730, partial [Steroidobacteraceae bacterium]|nr:hypothetical protein [Steroidobacteraceae bacterium]